MKLTLTFEIEISDIPEKDRLEMLNDAGMEDEDMPRISAMSEPQVRAEVTDAFYAMFDGSSYEDQSDMWAGSNFYGYITSIIAAPSPQSDVTPAFTPTHRHKKRGSVYQIIAHGRLQVDGDLDMEKVTIYQAEDGTTWVRPDYEFNDGRFEALADIVKCPDCNGLGAFPDTGADCGRCYGGGEIATEGSTDEV